LLTGEPDGERSLETMDERGIYRKMLLPKEI
jgi:hypothetical protein